jgi:hypothetical protein
MQKFSKDPKEEKLAEVTLPVLASKSTELTNFYNGCYSCFPFGAMLYDEGRTPLSNAIEREIFIESFGEVFEAFTVAGSFESYISVFKKIFGDATEINFEVHDPDDEESPAPGCLNIDIIAAGVQLSDFAARYIESNEYVYDEIVDDEGDNIAFQTLKGFQSQYELEQMLFEMVPDGIYTEITLSFGEE